VATSRTRNLRLFLSSGLSTEAKANLEILDRLGGVYQVDNSEAINIRSKTDIRLLPGDFSAGGNGTSSLYVGSEATPVAEFKVYASVFELNGSLRLPDYLVPLSQPDPANPGQYLTRKYLTIRYDSTKQGAADTAANRELILDIQNGNRALILAQDLELAGGFRTKLNTTATTDVVLPVTGTLATLEGTETFLNKTLTSPHITTPTGIVKGDVGLGNVDNTSDATKWAATATLTNKTISGSNNTFIDIPYTGLDLTDSIVNADIKSTAAIAYSKLSLANSITNSDISSSAAISPAKIQVSGIAGISSTNLQTALEELQIDINSRATQVDFSNHISDASAHGTTSQMVGVDDEQTLRHKTIDANPIAFGGTNTISNIRNASIHPSAEIDYSKLNLTNSVKDSDWSNIPANRLDGAKVAPNFGAQLVETESGLRIGQTYTTLLGVQSQTQDLNFRFPPNAGGLNYVLATDGAGNTQWIASSSTGTVSKVGLLAPSILSVVTRDGSGSPIAVLPGDPAPYITATGYFDISLTNQAQNLVLASPAAITGAPTFRSLITADLPAPLNSDAARNQAISDQTAATLQASTNNAITWSYNAGTKELRPTLSLTPYSTSNLSEGTRLYYTDERVATKAKGMIAVNDGVTSGITIAHGSSPDSITFSLRQATINTDSITEGTTNVFFTDERAQDAINALLIDSTEIAKTYDDTGNQLSVSLKTTGVTNGSYGSATQTVAIAVDSKGRLTSAAQQDIAIASTQITDFSEAVQDVVGATLVGASNDIAPTYTDASNSLTLAIKKEAITSKTEVSPTSEDYLLISDASDSDNLKKVSLQAIANLSGANFTATWATADGTSKVITHSLGSRDVLIQIYSLDTFEDILVDSVVRTDVNTVTLTASEVPTGSGWKVLIRRI
jgi:hypothetical protein